MTPAAGPDPFCPMCGREVGENAVWRFDVRFCSEAHAEEYAQEKARARSGR